MEVEDDLGRVADGGNLSEDAERRLVRAYGLIREIASRAREKQAGKLPTELSNQLSEDVASP